MGALNHVFFCVIGFEHGGMWISHCAHANVVVCVLVIVYKCGIFECVCLLRLRDQPIFCLWISQSFEQRLLAAQIKTGNNSFSLTLYGCACESLGVSACLPVHICVQACVSSDVHACCVYHSPTNHILFKIHIQHFALFSSPLFAPLPFLSILGCY